MAIDKKHTTVLALQGLATTLASAYLQAIDVKNNFYKRDYSGSMLDEDILSTTGNTAAEVTNGITMAEQFISLLEGGSVTTGDYLATISNLRNDK